jgi:hypothetical protein
VLIIKEGRIVEESDVLSLKSAQRKGFIIKPQDAVHAANILKLAVSKCMRRPLTLLRFL